MRAGLLLAVFSASLASSHAQKACFAYETLADCCGKEDGRDGEYKGQKCVPTAALVAGEAATDANMFVQKHVCQPKCFVDNSCADTHPGNQEALAGVCPAPAPTPAPAPAPTPAPVTTTATPWDSSASSSDSKSLESSYSSSFKDSDSSAKSSFDSSGSDASGSSGSYMKLWQWLLLLCCCCAALGGVLPALMKPKPKKKAPKKKPAPAPAPAPAPEPIVTTSTVIPSYQMVQQPVTTAYAAPVQYAAPATTAYAAPATTAYAAPAMTSYAAPAYAAATPLVGTTSYATGGVV